MQKREIEKAIQEYQTNIKIIDQLRSYLKDAGENITRQYGIASGQPKPQGFTGDPVHMETIRREKKWRWLQELEAKNQYILDHLEDVKDSRERAVLEYTLDGLTNTEIAQRMGASRRQIQNLSSAAAGRMAKEKITVGG